MGVVVRLGEWLSFFGWLRFGLQVLWFCSWLSLHFFLHQVNSNNNPTNKLQAAAAAHPRRLELCDPTSSSFATHPAILSPDNKTVITGDLDPAWSSQQPTNWPRLLAGTLSPLCELLGAPQRAWLREVLGQSSAPLKLVGSGSVVAGSIGHPEANGTSECDGDDWACWPRAQVNLLHTLANASGCVVLLTGDYHISDIKVIMPGSPKGTNYSSFLQTEQLAKPIYQVRGWAVGRHCRLCFSFLTFAVKPNPT